MELKKQILIALGIEDKEIALSYQAKLVDGTIIVSDADELVAGVNIMVLAEDGTTIPLPIGEYETEDGTSFSVVEEGVVAEIYEDEETEEVEEETEEEVEEVEADVERKPKKVKETKEVEFDKEGLINEIGAVIKELLQEVKTDIERLDSELNEIKGDNEKLESDKEELKAEVEKLSKEPASEPVKTSKFNEAKPAKLSKAEYRELTRKEKYWYNIKNN
tara:strand:+ start:5483 stop:6139 length:657 start_codon:yes stop_codon:yes gene_type:complete